MTQIPQLELKNEVLLRIQKNFPLVKKPFLNIANELHTTEERVLEILKQGIDGGNATFDKDVPSWETWDNKYFKLCRLVLVNENGVVQGWAAIQPISARVCYKGVAEVSIYLDNSVHGKGFGEMLLHKLIEETEEHHFWTLQSGIFPENVASIKIHEKLGFRIIGRREKIAEMNGIWRDVILLERRTHKFLKR